MDVWFRSESIDLCKITPDFYNNFSDFGGGERSGVPPSSRSHCLPVSHFLPILSRFPIQFTYVRVIQHLNQNFILIFHFQLNWTSAAPAQLDQNCFTPKYTRSTVISRNRKLKMFLLKPSIKHHVGLNVINKKYLW